MQDVAVNPADLEEALWCWCCDARLNGVPAAQAGLLRVRAGDSREVLRRVYELYANTGSLQELRVFAAAGSARDAFYALLYEGLYEEARSDADAARTAILAACASAYGQQSGDYMATVARTHARVRGWS